MKRNLGSMAVWLLAACLLGVMPAQAQEQEVYVTVMCVGAVLGYDHANTILAAGRADLVAMARPHLVNPHITLDAAVAYGYHDQFWPPQYLPAKPAPKD